MYMGNWQAALDMHVWPFQLGFSSTCKLVCGFYLAAQLQDARALEAIICRDDVPPGFPATALRFAAASNRLANVQRIAAVFACVLTPLDYQEALNAACFHNQLETVAWLCTSAPTTVHAVCSGGTTPWLEACKGGALKVLEYFNASFGDVLLRSRHTVSECDGMAPNKCAMFCLGRSGNTAAALWCCAAAKARILLRAALRTAFWALCKLAAIPQHAHC